MQNLKVKFQLIIENQEQIAHLESMFGASRFIYNLFLNEEKAQYRENQKFNFYNKNSAILTQVKKLDGYEWLNDHHCSILQNSLRKLDTSLTKYLKERKSKNTGFPKFKKKNQIEQSISFDKVEFARNIKDGYFKIKKLKIKINCHREIPYDFKSCSIKRELNGKYYISFVIKQKKLPKRTILTSTGVDLNSKNIVTTMSEHEVLKPLLENQKKIKHLQRQLTRRKKGSSNWKRTLKKLQKLYFDCQNQKMDWFHKLTYNLCTKNDLVSIEDLDAKSIQMKYGKIIQNNGFGIFKTMMEYKSELYGCHLVKVDRYFPSSQLCCACDAKNKHKLSDRVYHCKLCGFTLDRDKNAAINIDFEGLRLINLQGWSVPALLYKKQEEHVDFYFDSFLDDGIDLDSKHGSLTL